METKRQTRSLRYMTIMSTMLALWACESGIDSPGFFGNYMAQTNTTQQYKRDIVFPGTEADTSSFGMVQFTVSGDTVESGLTYHKVIQENSSIGESPLIKIVRRKGTKYFERIYRQYSGGFMPENMVLDTERKTGDRWTSLDPLNYAPKQEYIIDDHDATVQINDVEYEHVIKLHVNYYYLSLPDSSYELRNRVDHFYAQGVGEIYSYYPYPLSGMYADVILTLVP